MPPVGFEPTISAGERPQTYALDHAATGTGIIRNMDSTFRGAKKEKRIRVQGLREIVFVFCTDFHVGIAVTRLVLQSDYGLEDREFGVQLEVRIRRCRFSIGFTLALGTAQCPLQWIPELFPRRYSDRGCEVT